MNYKFSALALLAGLALISSGCIAVERGPRTRVVRTVTVQQPAPAPQVNSVPVPSTPAPAVQGTDYSYETRIIEREDDDEGVVVTEAPPPPPVEVVIVRPSPRHVWIGGYWHWQHNRYHWVGGHWMLPPHRGVYWVGPRFVVRHGVRVYIGGSWVRHRHH